jgi:hypothetical protein
MMVTIRAGECWYEESEELSLKLTFFTSSVLLAATAVLTDEGTRLQTKLCRKDTINLREGGTRSSLGDL